MAQNAQKAPIAVREEITNSDFIYAALSALRSGTRDLRMDGCFCSGSCVVACTNKNAVSFTSEGCFCLIRLGMKP